MRFGEQPPEDEQVLNVLRLWRIKIQVEAFSPKRQKLAEATAEYKADLARRKHWPRQNYFWIVFDL